MFIFIAIVGSWIVGLLGIAIAGILIPPPLKRAEGQPFDKNVSLNLADKAERDKNTNP
jgi:hypothetical protein